MKITDLKDYHVVSTAMPAAKPQSNNVTDFAKGAVKGLTRTTVETARLANSAAEFAMPSLKAINDAWGNNPLRGDTPAAREIDTQLATNNAAEKAGDWTQFIATALYPVGKTTAVKNAAQKVGASFEGVGSRISSLGGDGSIKERIFDAVSNLDDKTKTALKRTPQDVFQKYLEKGKAALMDDRNRTPFEEVGDNIIAGLKQIKDRAGSAGAAKSQIMEQAKVGYKKVGTIAQKTALGIQKSFSGVKLDASDAKIVKDFQTELMKLGNNPSLREVDAVIDLLQDRLYKARRSNAVEVTDRITGKLRSAIGELNGQVKKLGGDAYSKANDEYSELADTVRELNARLGKEGGTAGAFVKRLFSPSDARTKELFEKLQKFTGQDYFRDARIAKFVMDTLGDDRAAKLLEQIPDSASGVIGKAVEFAKNKISDPIKAAERFINKQKK